MKTKVLSAVFLITITLFSSCNNDDNTTPTPENSILGIWNLSNVSGGLIGVNIDYSPGMVSLDFHENNMVLVENNIITAGPEDIYAGFETGTYTYEIQINGDASILFVDAVDLGVITITQNNLEINQLVSDGFLRIFQR